MKQMITIDVDKWKLFEMLCRELDMDFVLDTERKFYIHNGQVYAMENGAEHVYDDRANLFVSLRNTLVQMCPNCGAKMKK